MIISFRPDILCDDIQVFKYGVQRWRNKNKRKSVHPTTIASSFEDDALHERYGGLATSADKRKQFSTSTNCALHVLDWMKILEDNGSIILHFWEQDREGKERPFLHYL